MPEPVQPPIAPSIKSTVTVDTVSNSTVIGTQIGSYVAVYLVGSAAGPAGPRSRDTSPFKFLESYTVNDQDIFFGRETLCGELSPVILGHPRTSLVGEPGIGKTSLVQAALIPALARDARALALSVGDYESPLAGLRSGLRAAINKDPGLSVTLPSEDSFTALVTAWVTQTQRPFVIFFDQFERLLSLPFERQRSFAEPVLDAQLRNPDLFRIVFVLRKGFEEAAAALGANLNRGDLLGQIEEVPGLNHDEATRAIAAPLHVDGDLDRAEVEPALIDEYLLPALDTLDGSKDGRVEPGPLQIVCSRLYDQARDEAGPGRQPVISVDLYKQLNGCDGILRDFLSRQKENLNVSDSDWRSILKLLAAMAASDSLPFYPAGDLARQVGLSADKVIGWLQRLEQQRLVQERADGAFALIGNYAVRAIRLWFPDQFNGQAAEETLDRAMADWEEHRLLTERTRLQFIQRAHSLLQFTPAVLLLLVRSAVAYESDRTFWLAKLGSDDKSRKILLQLVEGDTGSPEAADAARVLEVGPSAKNVGEAAVRSTVESIRITAALVLGVLGAETVLEQLRPFLRSRSTTDRMRAAWAIAWIR
ncbi:MAG: hypothetical protein ACM3JD_05005, partial [Rudaea sp.]